MPAGGFGQNESQFLEVGSASSGILNKDADMQNKCDRLVQSHPRSSCPFGCGHSAHTLGEPRPVPRVYIQLMEGAMPCLATLSLWLPFLSPTETLLACLCRFLAASRVVCCWPPLTALAMLRRLRTLGSSGAMAASQGFFSQPLGSSSPPTSLAGWNTAEALQQLQNKVTPAADSTLFLSSCTAHGILKAEFDAKRAVLLSLQLSHPPSQIAFLTLSGSAGTGSASLLCWLGRQ